MHSNFSLSSGFSKDMPVKIFTASGPMQCRNNATLYASGCEVIFMIIAQFCHAWLKVFQLSATFPFTSKGRGGWIPWTGEILLAIVFVAVVGVATVDVLVEVVSSLSLVSVVIKITLPPCFNKLCTVLDGTEIQWTRRDFDHKCLIVSFKFYVCETLNYWSVDNIL